MNDPKIIISLVVALILAIAGLIARSGIRRMDLSPVQRRRTKNMVIYALFVSLGVGLAVTWAEELAAAKAVLPFEQQQRRWQQQRSSFCPPLRFRNALFHQRQARSCCCHLSVGHFKRILLRRCGVFACANKCLARLGLRIVRIVNYS